MKRAFTESQPSIPPGPGRQDPPPWKVVHLVKLNVTIRLVDETLTTWIGIDDSPFSIFDVNKQLYGYVLEDGRLASGDPPWRQNRRDNPSPLRSAKQFRIASTEVWTRHRPVVELTCGCDPHYERVFFRHDDPITCMARQIGQAVAEGVRNHVPLQGMRIPFRNHN
ncbi:hypothetical protein GCK72_000368 [Caenorhabditis remanei]|uniref:Uncharacterized protein n=1 Tax=Caenorhabditis remanei TaxID=31234 RepID=A0A6A5HPF7_CAERE|nr:hypothetical protein GCK72_000368 [Caenorhabditis remanei]KAF1768556.1 hypothetical protein GCK72_000368 [Caenorhabditis remanei]